MMSMGGGRSRSRLASRTAGWPARRAPVAGAAAMTEGRGGRPIAARPVTGLGPHGEFAIPADRADRLGRGGRARVELAFLGRARPAHDAQRLVEAAGRRHHVDAPTLRGRPRRHRRLRVPPGASGPGARGAGGAPAGRHHQHPRGQPPRGRRPSQALGGRHQARPHGQRPAGHGRGEGLRERRLRRQLRQRRDRRGDPGRPHPRRGHGLRRRLQRRLLRHERA